MGLPRVEGAVQKAAVPEHGHYERRSPGVVSQDDTKKNVVIKVTGKDENGAEVVKSYSSLHPACMSCPASVWRRATSSPAKVFCIPQDIPGHQGPGRCAELPISEVQKVYSLQGVEINDKHIEGHRPSDVPPKVRVTDSGSSDLIGGALANRLEVENINAELQSALITAKRASSWSSIGRCCWASPRLPWQTSPSCLPHPSRRPPVS